MAKRIQWPQLVPSKLFELGWYQFEMSMIAVVAVMILQSPRVAAFVRPVLGASGLRAVA
jgi:hypothetical protein